MSLIDGIGGYESVESRKSRHSNMLQKMQPEEVREFEEEIKHFEEVQ